jgi:hypothetical protein
MNMDGIERRVAAWVLTLPGPMRGATPDEAARAAHALFDPSVPRRRFEAALAKLGYVIGEEGQLLSRAVPHKDDARSESR